MQASGGKRKAEKGEWQDEWSSDPDFNDGPSWILHFGKGGGTEDDDRPGYGKKNKKKSKWDATSGEQEENRKSNENQGREGQRGQKGGRRGGQGNQKGAGGGPKFVVAIPRGGRGGNHFFGFPRGGRGINQRGRFGGSGNQRGFGRFEGYGADGFGGGGYGADGFRRGGYGEYGGGMNARWGSGAQASNNQGSGLNRGFNFNRGRQGFKQAGPPFSFKQDHQDAPFSQFGFSQENNFADDMDDDEETFGQQSNPCPPFVWDPSTGQLVQMPHELDPNIAKMSTLDKMRQFVNTLRISKSNCRFNPVMVIENGLTASKVGFRTNFEVELLMRYYGRAMFTGVLYIDKFFMARSVAQNKKQAKLECYEKGLEHLYRKPLQYLMSMHDVGAEAVRNELRAIYQDLTPETFPMEAVRAFEVVSQAANFGERKFAKKAGLFNLESSLAKLINFLKYSNQVTPNAVCRMTQAFTSSKCNLCHDYEEDMQRLKTGQMWFKGRMYIGDIVIAGAGDYKKKEAKEKTHQRTVENLLNNPLETILKGVSLLEIDDSPPKFETASNEPGGDTDSEKTVKRLEKLAALLKPNSDKEELVMRFDMACNTLQLMPTCLFRRGRKGTLICELYVDNILIAVGQEENRKSAQLIAYTTAYDIIVGGNPEEIIKDAKRLTKEEMSMSDILEIGVKGQSRWGESNITKLKRLGIEPSLTVYGVEEFVIMEHYDWSKDRIRNAFVILNQSATQNGMLLEWNISPSQNLFKCSMRLQGKDIGDASASAKQSSRNLAAIDSLFRLYETQPVIRSLQRNETQFWNTYESIKVQAHRLKISAASKGDEGDEWVDCTEPVPQTPMDINDVQTMELRDSLCQPVNKWVLQVLTDIVTQYAETETLEDLLFGPGFPVGERKKITLMCQKFGLKYIARQFKEQSYTAVFKNWSPQEMVVHLQKNGGTSGKYILVNTYELPKHSEARAFILNQEQISKQKIESWKQFQTYQAMPGGNPNTKTPSNPTNSSFNTSTPKMSHVQQQPFFAQKSEPSVGFLKGGFPGKAVGTPITKKSPIKSPSQQYTYGYVEREFDPNYSGGFNTENLSTSSSSSTYSQYKMPSGSFNQTPSSYHTATSFQSMPVVYSSGASGYATPDSSNTYGISNLYMSF